MTNTTHVDERGASAKSLDFRSLAKHKKPLLIGVAAIVVVTVIIFALFTGGKKSTRTESYKDVSGAAGLQATITHDGKPATDFTVYIFKDDGQQVAVVRPDKDGKVHLALPESNYIMMIGKRFGKSQVFPEEPLALKNGKMLELKLHYE